MNKLFDENITLDREAHIYNLATNPDLKFISATTFIDTFFEKFDSKKIAGKLVKSSPKYMDMTVAEVLQSWKNSGIHGTIVHEEIETYLRKNITYSELKEDKSILAIDWLNKYKMKSDFEMYPEVIIYSEELKIAGTIDLLLHDKISNRYIILDWKTSKNITTKAYNNKKGIQPSSLNIEDTKFNHYALQLSLYRYLLEKYYKLNFNEQLIVHLKDNQCIGIHSPYMENHIIKMIESIKG